MNIAWWHRFSAPTMETLAQEEGLALLDAALGRDEAHLVPARLDVAGLRARAGRGEDVPALWRQLAGQGARRQASAGADGSRGADGAKQLRARLAGLPPAGQDRVLTDLLRANVAAVLGHASADAVEPGHAFSDLGFDSLTAVELRNRLNAATGLRLPATLVFDYPSPELLAAHLRAELVGDQEDTAAEADESTLRNLLATVPISKIRDAGLLDALLRLAAPGDGTIAHASMEQSADSIDALDAESLVRMALNTEQAD